VETDAESFTRRGFERPQIVQAAVLVQGMHQPELKGVTKQQQHIEEGALASTIGTDQSADALRTPSHAAESSVVTDSEVKGIWRSSRLPVGLPTMERASLSARVRMRCVTRAPLPRPESRRTAVPIRDEPAESS
jgi:hypothetical protein